MRVWLTDDTMQAVQALHPLSLRLERHLYRLGEGEMLLPAGESIPLSGLVALRLPDGSTEVYVAAAAETDGEGTAKWHLRHGLCLLERDILPEDENPAVRPANEVVKALLAAQSKPMWQAGTIDCRDAAPWQTGGCTLLDDLLSLRESLSDACLTFDMARVPWRLNLLRLDDGETPRSELRLTRNVTALDLKQDTEGMATRLYPVGSGGVTIASVNGGCPYIERNTDRYGIITAVDVRDEVSDPGQLMTVSKARLRETAHPAVSVSVEGLDLADATGEPLDRLSLGRVCRIRLPDGSMTERIVSVVWEDLIGCPERVRVTLATDRIPLTERMKNQLTRTVRVQEKVSRRSARRHAKAEKTLKDHGTSIVKNEYLIRLNAWARQKTAAMIRDRQSTLTMTPEAIRTEVSETVTDDSDGVLEQVRSVVEQTAGQIVLSAREIALKADKVTVNAKITEITGLLEAQSARINDLMSGHAIASSLTAGTVSGTEMSASTLHVGAEPALGRT